LVVFWVGEFEAPLLLLPERTVSCCGSGGSMTLFHRACIRTWVAAQAPQGLVKCESIQVPQAQNASSPIRRCSGQAGQIEEADACLHFWRLAPGVHLH